MTATLSRIVLDRVGEPQMIVHPDFDTQLNDPAYAPAGTTQIDVPRFFSTVLNRRALLVIIQAKLAENNRPLLASIVQARIDLMDAVDQAQADYLTWQTRLEAWPSPTQAQQLLITAAAVKYSNSVQAAQDKRDALAALVAQLP
jgi:hypothetical protein